MQDFPFAIKVKVSSNALAESHSICSAAGAIYARTTFTQSNGTLTIANSSTEERGGAVHLGAPSGEFRGRFILVVVSGYVHLV